MGVLFEIIMIHLLLIFIVSSISKFIAYRSFSDLVIQLHIFPVAVSRLVGFIIPFIELIGAFLLIFSSTIYVGIVVLSFLLVCFLYVVIKMIVSKRTIHCGCYGSLLNAKMDRFTVVKIIYLLFLLTVLVTGVHYINSYPSLYSIITGIFATILFLAVQKIWSMYQYTVSVMKKNQ